VPGGIRSFIALDLPEAHREALADHLERCTRLAPGFRWVAPDALHLTLRFLGHLDPATLDDVSASLDQVSGAPFQISLGGTGTFGSRAAPRVVWLGIDEGLAACRALARQVEAACQVAGLEADARGFRAHVTLGRARADGERLPELPELPRLAPWRVQDFVLYESRLKRWPRYVALGRYSLSASAV
jgi:2'-5' RNA ligase